MVAIDPRRLEGAYSASYPLDVLGPQDPPVLTTLAPASIVVATPTPCTITGTGFHHNAVVVVDGVVQGTTWLSATQIRYLAEATSVGSQDVTARNGGSAESNMLVMAVTATREELEAAAASVSKSPKGGNGKPKAKAEPEPEPEPKPEPEAE